ncbi:hypothetical protein O0L34_g16958 [Tuta absoluta]|nr:hypothetical protein O0L34_g16958 [Tuta absoluta]
MLRGPQVNTPAPLSGATSLSSLTIDDKPTGSILTMLRGPQQPNVQGAKTSTPDRNAEPRNIQPLIPPLPQAISAPSEPAKGGQTPGSVTYSDSCKVFMTEDTPAVLSGVVSRGNLSPLSIRSRTADAEHTSDSSNLSDIDLLEDTIQKGIAKVVKNKGSPTEAPSANHYRDDFYRSLPPYLRSSTETVKGRERSAPLATTGDSPPPPLPPRGLRPPAEPMPLPDGHKRPPAPHRPRPPALATLNRAESLSSLSADSFGSTDREIFEETVKAGLSCVSPRLSGKAHSVERPSETVKTGRQHKSLDRSDKLANRGRKARDGEFERIASKSKSKKEDLTCMTRSPYSYHGESSSYSLAQHSRRSLRYYDDGPPSLPARIDDPRRPLERSNSLSSLSNDSFGSTDKEVFERCVRMGMSKAQPKSREDKLRVRSDDRLETRESRRRKKENRPAQGALDRMVGEEYSRDRAILEEVIAKGAGEHKNQSKNVPAPSVGRAAAGGLENIALEHNTGSENDSAFDISTDLDNTQESIESQDNIFNRSNELPTIDSGNTTLESTADIPEMDRSNECLAPKSVNTTIDSEIKDELNRSNESYADVLDGTWSDPESPKQYEAATLTRKNKNMSKLEWTDINFDKVLTHDELSKKSSTDTWNDNTVPDDITFPTISGSVHMVSSLRSEIADAAMALPDLLEKSDMATMSFSRPDLTNKLDEEQTEASHHLHITEDSKTSDKMLENVPEPSFTSLIEDGEPKFDSIMSSVIEREAARLAAQLKITQFNAMENSVTSLTSLDLENVRPPSNLGSLLSLSASGHWDESSAQTSKKSQRSRKKSLPVALMVKRALSNSYHQGSTEHLDSNPVSLLDNVKPPSDMEHLDMESSMVSVSSIVSEVAEVKDKVPVVPVFDLKQPVQDFPMCNTVFNTVYHDLDNVNPPSLFNEMTESTMEMEQTTVENAYEDCISTLNVVTDIPSGSENGTPLPSDMSSVESTPKKQRSNYLTPKEKRYVAKDRYQTYTITDTDTITENEVLTVDTEDYLTWTKSESDRSEDYVTAASEIKSKRKASAKQRRLEDRARYQTQTVDIRNIIQESSSSQDPNIESLKQRLASKKTMKQKRAEDAERFRTRTLSEDIPPSPTFVTKDAFENVETTTGYDSLSSNEPNHQQILDDRQRDDEDVFSRDSGHNDDDFDVNFSQMQTYTKSFRGYLPSVESPTAVDMIVVNNLKNIEMTESYRRALGEKNNPSSSDFASFEDDSAKERALSDSDTEMPQVKAKPKIIKPENRRDESLDSNESIEKDSETPKAIRGRKKALYVSPYRRNIPNVKKTSTDTTKAAPKPSTSRLAPVKPTNVKTATKSASKPPSASSSPKKSIPTKTPSKIAQKPITIPLVAATAKPLPLERQGTFTKEESTIPPKDLPIPKTNVPRMTKATTPTTPTANKSPSRLPQPNRYSRPPLTKAKSQQNSKQTKPMTSTRRQSEASIKNSPSTQSLQSNDSGKTVTLNKSSRQGSTSSVNSQQSSSKTKSKDVESKIANLWKKVEQCKTQPAKPDKRIWIESDKPETPKLIRSSTFEGQPKSQVPTAPKQKTAIGMRVSQIPSLRGKPGQSKTGPSSPKKVANTRIFTRKPVNGQS